MKKGVLIFLILMIALTGCKKNSTDSLTNARQDEKDNNVVKDPTQIQENKSSISEVSPTIEVQDDSSITAPFKLDTYAAMIGQSKQEVTAKLGTNYTEQPVGISKLDQGLYYDNIKMSFFFNGDQRLQYIEYQGQAEFLDKNICSDFSTIRKEYGEAETAIYAGYEGDDYDKGMIEECFEFETEIYELSYHESDYVIAFASKEELGKNYTIYVYKPVGFLSSNEIRELLDYDTSQIQKRFGKDCILNLYGEEAFPCWDYYRAIGLYFGVNQDHMEESKYIQFAPWLVYEDVHAGLTFEEVWQKLGVSRIIKENRYMMGCEVYTIEYRKQDYFLSFEAYDTWGNDTTMQLAKTAAGYRDKLFEDVLWNIQEDSNCIGFTCENLTHYIYMDDAGPVFPIYDSVGYKRFGIPDEALGAAHLAGGYTGSIECFYIAYDEEDNLNLYVKRYADDEKQEVFVKEKVLQEHQDERYARLHIISGDTKPEVLAEQLTKEDKETMNQITDSLNKHVIYQCFSTYDDEFEQWPKELEKKVYYDFNQDGEIEELAIHFSFGIREEEAKDGQAKDSILEISLGNQKIVMIRKAPIYSDLYVGICDIDTTDNYIEIYTTEFEDCYGDSILYRLNGDSLEVANDLEYQQLVGVSGDGKIYTYDGVFRYIVPEFDESYEDLVMWYVDYKTDKIVYTDEIIGKTYKATWDDIFFQDISQAPYGAPIQITMNLEGAFYDPEFGEVLTILDVYPDSQLLKVRNKDGKEGFIGGHHMVWN